MKSSVDTMPIGPSPSSGLDGRYAISLAMLGGAGVITALLWSSLPDRIPTHFGIDGAADDYSSKAFGVAILPAVAAILFVVLRVVPRFLSPRWRERAAASPMSLVTTVVTGLVVGLHAICLWAAMHPGASAAKPLAIVLGGFWIALSLVLPRVRRNPFVGFRTTWTLSSDENWARTHRFAGLVGVAAGIVVIVAGLAGSFPAAIAAIAAGAIAPAAYSFILSRRLPTHPGE
jgi:uncharacterized membrane protein